MGGITGLVGDRTGRMALRENPSATRWQSSAFGCRYGVQDAITGVDSGSEFVMIRDAGQQRVELLLFGVVECREQVASVLAGGSAELSQQVSARIGEMEGMQPPVLGVAAPFDQFALLQCIQQRDQSGGGRAELSGQRLLAATGFGSDRPEHTGLRRRQLQSTNAVGEPLGGMRSDLREQERRLPHLPRRPRLIHDQHDNG